MGIAFKGDLLIKQEGKEIPSQCERKLTTVGSHGRLCTTLEPSGRVTGSLAGPHGWTGRICGARPITLFNILADSLKAIEDALPHGRV